MSPYSEKSKLWREQNKELIAQWKKKYEELLDRRRFEWWNQEKFDGEIGSALPNVELQDIWFFVTSYAASHPSSHLGFFYAMAAEEIKTYGTIELSRLRRIQKSIQTTRRKKYGK